jgi:hypothetical protein
MLTYEQKHATCMTSKQPRMVRTFLKVHTRPRLAYGVEVTESNTNKLGNIISLSHTHVKNDNMHVDCRTCVELKKILP